MDVKTLIGKKVKIINSDNSYLNKEGIIVEYYSAGMYSPYELFMVKFDESHSGMVTPHQIALME